MLTPLAAFALPLLAVASADASAALDLTDAAVVFKPGEASEPVRHLILRAAEHMGRPWDESKDGTWPNERRPIIAVGLKKHAKAWAGPLAEKVAAITSDAAEGFSIVVDPEVPAVAVAGNDARGVVFGVGRLLRELRIDKGSVRLPRSFALTTAPKTLLRGHQLGYRAKTNSYDAWDEAQWERYIWDLAAFGANAIELIPPRTDDDLDSPHFPLPPLEMMERMSKRSDSLHLDVWVWFPVMDPVDTDPSKVEPLLKEWDEVFRKLPRLDAVFVPGGDPGHIPPKPLFSFLERAKEVLHRTHPKATLWVSPQGFDAPRFDEFLALVKAEPAWLDGVVFGPQVRAHLPELRKVVPAKYPIRGYPDITHSRQCQHPVPDWDIAYAATEGRESINPRPRAMASLVNSYAPYTVGSISYSEGCNDDVNKAVWSAQMWDPDADVVDSLRQYTRIYLGGAYEEPFAQVLLALERNWSGPLLTNGGVETALKQLQTLERDATPALARNWRFQQALYRGYYDAYARDRLIQEFSLQQQALAGLRNAPRLGSEFAMSRAETVLDKSLTEPISPDRRARVFELGEALFQSVRMQLSKPKYKAIDPERGANLDTIDAPLNDRVWLKGQFAAVRKLPSEAERLKALAAILDRTDPGPGGFYDDLGDPSNSPHLVREPSLEADPMLYKVAFQGFDLRTDQPMGWRTYTQTFHDAPIVMTYADLDPTTTYKVRMTYSGDSPRGRMRLEADGAVIHDLFVKPNPVRSVEFPLPYELTRDGRLTLKWNQEPGRGGNGRGCQLAEVWLIRAAP